MASPVLLPLTAPAPVFVAKPATGLRAGMAQLKRRLHIDQGKFRRGEERMRLLMESATDFAICMLDPAGFVVHWDKGAERLMQYRPAEIIGRHFSQFYTEQDQRRGRPAEALDVAKAEGRYDTEHWFVRQTGLDFWASGVIQPIFGDDGKVIGFAIIVRDATGRWLEQQALTQAKEDAESAAVKAEGLAAEVRAANSELQGANDRLQKFTSIVAHDLGAPLRRVETFVQLLHDDYGLALDSEGQDIMDRIEGGVARIRLMLSSLLDYSKCSRLAILGKTASLSKVISAVLEDLGLALVQAEVRIDLGDVDEVSGDPQLIGHVLQNLIGNAVKFRRPDRTPVVSVEAAAIGDGEVQISVTDNGIGIEPQYADRVFEMFYRLHDEEDYAGAGIGLSVCRKIVNDHGGRIWIDKTYIGGARAVFTLLTEAMAEGANRSTLLL